MERGSRSIEWLVWGGLSVTMACILGVFIWSRQKGSGAEGPPVYGQVVDFQLTNQIGEAISLADLRGKVWVADIIFTSCPGPCPKLSRRMSEIERALAGEVGVRMVSLTADPATDTPEVLRGYGEGVGAEPGRWLFLTGPKEMIYRLAVEGLKLAVIEKPEGERQSVEDMFVHSTILTVVDGEGRLRGFYEGLEPGAIEEVTAAVRLLLGER